MSDLRVCTRCVMDNTAEEISFDDRGVCSFCQYFDRSVRPILDRARSGVGRERLEQILERIRGDGHGKPHDTILGLSGGTDSSYLLHLAKELELCPLVVHVDTGWNSLESEKNIELLVSQLGYDLEVFKVDWEEMRDLQVAFYKASVKNSEIPQDHAFRAGLYKIAARHRIRYILTGGNLWTESILPRSWGFNAADLRHLIAIQKRFGTLKLRNFPTLGFWSRYFYYPLVRRAAIIRPLNYVPYDRTQAKRILKESYDWQDYGAKHYESVLTRFFQGYYLPTKFGIDKRKAHLSSLILAGEISRKEALEELKKPAYPNETQLEQDKTYLAQMLGLSLDEWEHILALPTRKHNEFPSSEKLFMLKDQLVDLAGIRRRRYY